jgi:hypothetical protein
LRFNFNSIRFKIQIRKDSVLIQVLTRTAVCWRRRNTTVPSQHEARLLAGTGTV